MTTPAASPTADSGLTPRVLYRRFALLETITWTGLILGMALKYGLGQGWATMLFGGIHGFGFLCYLVTTVFVWIDRRWSPLTGVVGLASSVVPYATIPFERHVEREGLVAGDWRLAEGGDEPRGAAEHLQAFALRRPLPAALIALVGVSVVFVLLLLAGPPTQWFG